MAWNKFLLSGALLLLVIITTSEAFHLSRIAPFCHRSTARYSSPTSPSSSVVDVRRRTLEAALAKMVAIGEKDFASSFNKRRLRSVEVKESSIAGAGLGLFAKEKMKAGTIIGFYPAHMIGINVGESIEKVSIDSGTGQIKYESKESEDSSYSYSTDQSYLIHILGNRKLMKTDIQQDLGGETIFIDVDLGQQEQPGFISHRINDGATVTTNNQEGVLEYYQASRRAKNCVLIPFGPSPLLAAVTTKKVNKGDELFTTYGCSYWLEALLKETGEAEETNTNTELIMLEAKGVAMDILKGTRDAAVTHAREAGELQTIFDAL